MPNEMIPLGENELAFVSGGAYTGSVIVYTARQGDDFRSLSMRFNTTVAVIQELNPELTPVCWSRCRPEESRTRIKQQCPAEAGHFCMQGENACTYSRPKNSLKRTITGRKGTIRSLRKKEISPAAFCRPL